jgi:DNA repair protein RecN (Recombination protein N)
MLCSLRIHNYAIIESVDVEFAPGMTVLTGETGAGKSILIGALSLALGERAEPEAIRSGESTAWVEGVFRLPPGHPLQDVLKKQDILLPGGEALVRREIAASGRSRAFLNDAGVTLATLKRFGDACVDLHGQHEHQSLLQEEKHQDFLDGFCGLLSLRQEFAERFQDYHKIEQTLRALKDREVLSLERRELYAFQIKELEAACLVPGEEEALLAEGRVLENAERLMLAASQVIEELAEGENAICSRVEEARKVLEEPAALDIRLKETVEGLATVSYQMEDIASSLRQYRDKLEFDPDRLEEIRERLDAIWRLKKKYGGSVESALEQLEKFREEIGSQESRAEEINGLEDEVAQSLRDLEVRAGNLSQKRQKGAKELASEVKQELVSLGLGKSQFEVRLTQEPSPDGLLLWKGERVRVSETGWDRVRFFFNANPGEDLRPLDRVASGGEISRVMLALKTVLAEVDRVPTLIFDEIDAGIGGKVAEAVGRKLSAIARQRQVFCITHLPQIASQGDEHLLVEKHEAKGRTTVSVRKLSEGERIGELARMMAGKEITDLARAHAREMLNK